MAKKITAQSGQTIFDIAIQEYGSIEGVLLLIADNNLPSGLATVLTTGQVLFIKSAPSDAKMLAAIQKAGLTPKSSAYVPRITTYSYGLAPVGIVNNGGDDWTFNVPFDQANFTGHSALSSAQVFIAFFKDGSPNVATEVSITAPASYNFAGKGKGTYMIVPMYLFADTTFAVSALYVMVDDSGNVIRSFTSNGMTSIVVDGMRVSLLADISFNNCTPLSTTMLMLLGHDVSTTTAIGNSNRLLDYELAVASTVGVIFNVQLDPAEWTDAGGYINLEPGQAVVFFNTNFN